MASLTKLTPKKREKFLDSLAKTGNVSKSAKAIGVSRQAIYSLKKSDTEFSDLWDDALETGLDALEEEARRRAYQGTLKPIYQQGKKVGQVREFSDTLMIFLLKGGRPQKYRENIKVSVENLDAAIEHQLARLANRGEDSTVGEVEKPRIN